jgi:hypothetical protein
MSSQVEFEHELFKRTPWAFFSSLRPAEAYYTFVFSCLGMAVAVAITLICDATGAWNADAWDKWSEPKRFARTCEQVHTNRFLFQPGNSLSNVGFMLVGFWILAFGIADIRQRKAAPALSTLALEPPKAPTPTRKRRQSLDFSEGGDPGPLKNPPNMVALCPAMSILTGTFTIFVGIGSFIYHASYSMLGGKLDISVMYLIITQFCCTVIARFISHEQDITKIAWKGNGFVLLGLCSAAVLFTYRMTPTLTMGGIQEPLIVGMFLLGAFGIAVPATCTVYTKSTHLEEHDQQSRCFWPCCCVRVEQRPRSWMYTVLAVLSFVVALFCRITDKDHLCFGDPFGHAVWHVLMALAIFFAYLFLRSECLHLGYTGKLPEIELPPYTPRRPTPSPSPSPSYQQSDEDDDEDDSCEALAWSCDWIGGVI